MRRVLLNGDWIFERRYIYMAERITESVVVSIDIAQDGVSAILVVGKQGFNGIEIINAFQGKEAISLYNKLTDFGGEGIGGQNE